MQASSSGITLLGLGPGAASLLTRQAWDWLESCEELHVRTSQHPALAGLPESVKIISFDHLYESGNSFEEVYAQIVDQVLELARRPEGVTYAVPGHPLVSETTGVEILHRARLEGLTVRVIEGLSFLEPAFSLLGVDPFPHTSLVDALELGNAHVPLFPPSSPALICQVYSQAVAAQVKLTLMETYPPEHRVKLVSGAGTLTPAVQEMALFEIDRVGDPGLLSCLYVPSLGVGSSFEDFQEIVAHLRAPDGCPWDREQTHASLRQHLLEEAYETLEALDSEDPHKMAEEFGDLLLQIVLHAQIANEEGEFTITDMIRNIYNKIVRRHPHVFGDFQVKGVGGVLANWEVLKATEREEKGEAEEKGLLGGVPISLPALTQAQEYQERAARVGFDWPEIDGVVAKVPEEIEELKQATNPDEVAWEVGDLFFAVVNVARWKQVDAESALREANRRFARRFRFIEQVARRQGKTVAEMSFDEMDHLWNEAKKHP